MSFKVFSFNDKLTTAIERCGFSTPTPIQQQAIPPILKRRDLLGLAQTGTGKTAAFILPLVQQLMQQSDRKVRALIIAPTRELAEQINDFAVMINRNNGLRSVAIYGGVGKQGQIAQLRNGVDLVVACPGRLLDIINDRAIDLSRVETLVLDEADHMFDKGFLPDIRRILSKLPKERQNLVFSATMPNEIRHLIEDILIKAVTVKINPSHSVRSISHNLFAVEQEQKTDLLLHLLKREMMATTLVFTRTKHRAKKLASKLAQSGFKATSLQGNLSQNRRQQALDGFKNGDFNVLVATDIAARGIDVTGISHVVNFDMPDTAEAYIHRTGRTGRAARTGEALTFGTKEDGRMIRLIEQHLDDRMIRQTIAGLPATEFASLAARPRKPARNNNTRSNVFGLANRAR